MATKYEMTEAAEAFWGPQKVGTEVHIADIEIWVKEGKRVIGIRGRPHSKLLSVAGYWETGDIKLLELCSNPRNKNEGATISELLYRIVAEGAKPPIGELYHTRPPETILDLVTVEYDEKNDRSWLTGGLYDDRERIRYFWEPEPFSIGCDGLHAKWMEGHETWLELSAEPMAEYNRIFRRPIDPEEVAEMPTADSELNTLQTAIDAIERDIRQLRAKERDFSSTNIEMARRVGKQSEYEELLKQRDEAMWRENPKKAPVIYKATAHWKNGTTDVEVRQLTQGRYRVIDHCCEGLSPDGTGISQVFYNKQEAIEMADWYAAFLESRKNPCPSTE